MNYRSVVDDLGNVTSLWGEYTMTMGGPPFNFPIMGPVGVYAATRPAGGAWSAPVLLSTPGISSTVATLALGADGRVAAVWTEGTDILAATRTPTGGWATAAPIPSSGGTSKIDGAFAPDGRLTVVWQANSGGIRGAVRPAGGSWSAVATIASAGVQPVLAVDRHGEATVAWINGMKIFTAARDAAGTWSAPVQISVDGDLNYYVPAIATDRGGTVTVVWPQASNSSGTVRYDQKAATRTPAGWGAPVTIGQGDSGGLVVAAGAGGRTTAAWRGLVGGTWVVQSSTRAVDGTWSSPRNLSAAGAMQPAVAVDPDGDALVAWNESNRVKVQADDAAPPQLRDLTVPLKATIGTPVTFSVNPVDLWSGLGATTWTFGDGGSATGTSVTHTYTTSGNHTVTVISTDALGQPATDTATITVPAPQVAPAPVLDDAPDSKPEGTELKVDLGRSPAARVPVLCVSNRVIRLNWKLPHGVRASRIMVMVDGTVTASRRGSARRYTLSLKGRPAGSATVTVSAATRGGVLKTVRTYRLCVARQASKKPPVLQLTRPGV
jgi:hypothetical protein